MLDFNEDQAAGLRRLMAGPKPRIMTVLSASAGNGLPRILTNLAASLQRHGSDALIVHAGEAEADALRQYQLAGKPTLADAVQGKYRMEDVLRQAAGFSAALLAPSHLCRSGLGGTLEPLVSRSLSSMAANYDIVLVEARLNEKQQLPLALLNDSEILIQLDRKPASVQQAYLLIKQLYSQLGARPFGILVNDASEAQAQTVFKNIAGVAMRYLRLKLEYVGSIPPDEHLAHAARLGRSVTEAFPMAAVSQAFVALANRIDHGRQALRLTTA